MADTPAAEPATDRDDQECWSRWYAEVQHSQKDIVYTQWLERSKRITERYRDERNRASLKLRKYNVLWSNVQTLKPAIYSRTPKPIVERRFMDKDPAARLASTVLERVLSFQVEISHYHDHVDKSVNDYLLPGMGQVWVRYEPEFETDLIEEENTEVEDEERTADEVQNEGDGDEAYEKLSYERLCVDYVYYRDFFWGAARCWYEVPWVARRTWMTKSEVEERFGEAKAKKIVLDYTPQQMLTTDKEDKTISFFKKAEIWEIWNKADRTVYFIAPGTPGLVLEEKDDPLKLENFWPCPEPLFATQTSDTIVPVPDYYEYQDQAQELDDLTQRISMITTAIRANGVYDGSQKGVERLLQEGVDNKLIPVDNWAAFAEKGGSAGVISLIPMQEIAQVLLWLYEARNQVKSDMQEITGMSDIVRGQGNPNETATAQRIKGQFASLRLQERQEKVAHFCRDIIRIMAEIISEVFAPETLLEMSGMSVEFRDEVEKAGQAVPQPVPPQPDPNMPPEQAAYMAQQAQMQAQMQYQMAVQQAQQAKSQELQAEFDRALEILRSDKLRGFRVEIETDSTIQPDASEDKAAATELFTATLQGLEGAGAIVMQAPELLEPIGDLLMFTYRKFRVGRTIEASLEDALTKMKERMEAAAGQPKPPSEEQVKAQGEQAKMQMQMKAQQQKHDLDMQAKQADFDLQQQKNQMELERAAADMQIEREKLDIERQRMEMQRVNDIVKTASDLEQTQNKVTLQREQHAMKIAQMNQPKPEGR
jgi:hypothetical protein